LGKKPIEFPSSVAVTVSGRDVKVKGSKGTLQLALPLGTSIKVDEALRVIQVDRADDLKQSRANHGLARALVANMVQGVSQGFQKRLLIYGTGYNCKLADSKLHLNIGYTGRRRGIGSQFELPVPDGIEVEVQTPAARGDNDPAKLVIRGCDKQAVGQFAAQVHRLRRAEPYKGKGIRYEDETVRRKQGKSLTGT